MTTSLDCRARQEFERRCPKHWRISDFAERSAHMHKTYDWFPDGAHVWQALLEPSGTGPRPSFAEELVDVGHVFEYRGLFYVQVSVHNRRPHTREVFSILADAAWRAFDLPRDV